MITIFPLALPSPRTRFRTTTKLASLHFLSESTISFGPHNSLAHFFSSTEVLPILMPREEESNYQTFVSGIQQVAATSEVLFYFLRTFPNLRFQGAVLSALSVLSRKHLVVVAGVIDRRFNLNDNVLSYSGKLTSDSYAHFLYTYWLEERIRNFQYQAAKFGVGTVLVHEQDWMSVVIRLYSLMRASVRI